MCSKSSLENAVPPDSEARRSSILKVIRIDSMPSISLHGAETETVVDTTNKTVKQHGVESCNISKIAMFSELLDHELSNVATLRRFPCER